MVGISRDSNQDRYREHPSPPQHQQKKRKGLAYHELPSQFKPRHKAALTPSGREVNTSEATSFLIQASKLLNACLI